MIGRIDASPRTRGRILRDRHHRLSTAAPSATRPAPLRRADRHAARRAPGPGLEHGHQRHRQDAQGRPRRRHQGPPVGRRAAAAAPAPPARQLPPPPRPPAADTAGPAQAEHVRTGRAPGRAAPPSRSTGRHGRAAQARRRTSSAPLSRADATAPAPADRERRRPRRPRPAATGSSARRAGQGERRAAAAEATTAEDRDSRTPATTAPKAAASAATASSARHASSDDRGQPRGDRQDAAADDRAGRPQRRPPGRAQDDRERPGRATARTSGDRATARATTRADQRDQGRARQPGRPAGRRTAGSTTTSGGGRRRNRRSQPRPQPQPRRARPGGDYGSDELEPQIDEDDVLVPVAGILDVLDNYAFVRTTGYLPGAERRLRARSAMVKKNGLRKGDAVTGAVKASRARAPAAASAPEVQRAGPPRHGQRHDARRGPQAASSSAS